MQEQEQDNNNFETIINTWRRLSGELEKTTASMSGDHENQPYMKKEERTELLPADSLRAPVASAAGAGLVAAADDHPTEPCPEKPDVPQKDEDKDAAGDTNDNKSNHDEDDYLSGSDDQKSPMNQEKKQALGDKVDSVYLRAVPAHKTRATATAPPEEESCGFKCLYYTLQCCDCVLM